MNDASPGAPRSSFTRRFDLSARAAFASGRSTATPRLGAGGCSGGGNRRTARTAGKAFVRRPSNARTTPPWSRVLRAPIRTDTAQCDTDVAGKRCRALSLGHGQGRLPRQRRGRSRGRPRRRGSDGEEKLDGGRYTVGARTSLYDWARHRGPIATPTRSATCSPAASRPASVADFRRRVGARHQPARRPALPRRRALQPEGAQMRRPSGKPARDCSLRMARGSWPASWRRRSRSSGAPRPAAAAPAPARRGARARVGLAPAMPGDAEVPARVDAARHAGRARSRAKRSSRRRRSRSGSTTRSTSRSSGMHVQGLPRRGVRERRGRGPPAAEADRDVRQLPRRRPLGSRASTRHVAGTEAERASARSATSAPKAGAGGRVAPTIVPAAEPPLPPQEAPRAQHPVRAVPRAGRAARARDARAAPAHGRLLRLPRHERRGAGRRQGHLHQLPPDAARRARPERRSRRGRTSCRRAGSTTPRTRPTGSSATRRSPRTTASFCGNCHTIELLHRLPRRPRAAPQGAPERLALDAPAGRAHGQSALRELSPGADVLRRLPPPHRRRARRPERRPRRRAAAFILRRQEWTTAPRGPNHHAWEAMRNLNACVSCHTERDCATCHATKGVARRRGRQPAPRGLHEPVRGRLSAEPAAVPRVPPIHRRRTWRSCR